MQYVGDTPRFIRGSTHGGYAYGEAARGAYDRQVHSYTDPPHHTDPQLQPPDGAATLGWLATWAGAALSLVLVVGISIWAWQLTMRDVSGVPVIRALEGPVRTLPADPGGAQAPHQGLAVNRIAEGNEAAPVPDQLVLAPEPLDLGSVAVPVVRPTAEPAEPPVAGLDPETQAALDRILGTAPASLGDVEGPASSGESAAAAAEDAALTVADAVIPASVPGVSRSLRPLLRPAGLEASVAVTASSSVAQAAAAAVPGEVPSPASDGVAELAITDLPAGTRLVQLGAFDSAEIARAEWVRLAARYPDFFAGRARIVQQASSGGQEFFRLRANGFDSLDASRRFCAEMVARGAACIPVTIR
jgi:hypothetical protein